MKNPNENWRISLMRFLKDNSEAILIGFAVVLTTSLFLRAARSGDHLSDSGRYLILLLTVGGTGVTVFLFRFLSGDSQTRTDSHLSRQIDDLQREYKALSAYALDRTDHDKLVTDLRSQIEKEASESLLEELRAKARESEFAFSITERFEQTLGRIYQEIEALSRRATLNLILGILTAMSGIILLSYVVLGEHRIPATLTDFVTSFVPRLSIVTIIEVFAYFFLRLYKSSLTEIKYFQNEATNIEFHFTALIAALKDNHPDLVRETIQAFLRTERNPLLVGDQKDRTLETDKLYATPTSLSIQHIAAIVAAITKEQKADK